MRSLWTQAQLKREGKEAAAQLVDLQGQYQALQKQAQLASKVCMAFTLHARSNKAWFGNCLAFLQTPDLGMFCKTGVKRQAEQTRTCTALYCEAVLKTLQKPVINKQAPAKCVR